MEIVQTQKFVRMSPRKLRIVADVVRNIEANKAIELLPFTSKRAAHPLAKVITAAVANAKDRKVEGELIVKEVQINEGPTLKRGRAVSRGRWHPYMRRMSHIRVVLETVETVSVAETKSSSKKTVQPKSGESKVVKEKSTKKVNKTGKTKKTVTKGKEKTK